MYIVFSAIFCLALLQHKHLILDWIWQPEYEWKNKGTFLHGGGLLHAFKAAVGTGLVLLLFFPFILVLKLAVADFFIHYTIDLCKIKLTKYFGWNCARDPEFWWLLGYDQYLHQMTYLGLVAISFWTKYH